MLKTKVCQNCSNCKYGYYQQYMNSVSCDSYAPGKHGEHCSNWVSFGTDNLHKEESNKINFYTIECTACNILKTRLDKKNIMYTTISDRNIVEKVAEASGISNAPILEVDGKFYKYSDAIKWVGEQ